MNDRCSSDETEEDALWAAVERGQTPGGAATGTASLTEFRGAIIRLNGTIPSVLPGEESREEERNRRTDSSSSSVRFQQENQPLTPQSSGASCEDPPPKHTKTTKRTLPFSHLLTRRVCVPTVCVCERERERERERESMWLSFSSARVRRCFGFKLRSPLFNCAASLAQAPPIRRALSSDWSLGMPRGCARGPSTDAGCTNWYH